MRLSSNIFVRGLIWPAVLCLVVALTWGASGPVAALAILALGSGAGVLYHLSNMARVFAWARRGSAPPVPESGGVWGTVIYALHQVLKERAARHNDLSVALAGLRGAAEAMPDGVVLLDSSNHIQWGNSQGEKHLGLHRVKDRGLPVTNIVRHPEFAAYLDSGQYSEPLVMGSLRDSSVLLSVQIIPYGIDERLLITRDITRLVEAETTRTDFVANVSHELRTPLTVLTGFLEAFQDHSMDIASMHRYSTLMQEQAQNMQRLVEDLLTLSALESKESPLRDEYLAVPELLRVVELNALGLSGGRHRISLHAEETPPLRGAEHELLSAFGNLVSNAVRYTPDQGTIDLIWKRTPAGGAAFSVQDTGIGIEPDHLPRLTERFYRVDRSRSKKSGGTGLGLAIVKHIVVRHQAHLEIVSVPGKGSCFSIKFPRTRLVSEVADDAESAPETLV
jgi:two-component system, OmpR family, phosphate regulon sensor histidine kinase PhoR